MTPAGLAFRPSPPAPRPAHPPPAPPLQPPPSPPPPAGAGGSSRCWRGLLSWFLLPGHALLLNEIAILALFALSLDLILGYAGIVSLGHAAYFGFGAYVAALFAKHLLPDPLVGTGGRGRRRHRARPRHQRADPARLGPDPPDGDAWHRARSSTSSPTASTGSPAAPTACRASSWGRCSAASSSTCPAAPLTPTACWCCSLALLFSRRLVHSPFGISLQALRDNPLRAASIGLSVRAPAGRRLHHCGRRRRRGRRAARADLRLRIARRARFPPQRRRAAGAGDRRRRLSLRRHRRRRRIQAAARRDLGADAAVLDLLARPVPGRAGAGRPRPPGAPLDLVRERGQ